MTTIPAQPNTVNPLMQYMRQPKIYIKLPSNGNYWKPEAITVSTTGLYPVYSMTAKDELAFKTPDALLNGQAIVDVVQSCMTNIKDAWEMPSLDLDAILIAIRIATYGEQMEISHTAPNTKEEVENVVNLSIILDSIYENSAWVEQVVINDDISCFIKPLTYRYISSTGLKTFETQKLMQSVHDSALSDEEKLEHLNKGFNDISQLSIDMVAESVCAIQTPSVLVEDAGFIKEFITGADKEVVSKIQAHVTLLKSKNGVQPLTINSTEELIELGAPATYEIPFQFDNSSFFGRGS